MCRAGVEPAQPFGGRVTAGLAHQCRADTESRDGGGSRTRMDWFCRPAAHTARASPSFSILDGIRTRDFHRERVAATPQAHEDNLTYASPAVPFHVSSRPVPTHSCTPAAAIRDRVAFGFLSHRRSPYTYLDMAARRWFAYRRIFFSSGCCRHPACLRNVGGYNAGGAAATGGEARPRTRA